MVTYNLTSISIYASNPEYMLHIPVHVVIFQDFLSLYENTITAHKILALNVSFYFTNFQSQFRF